MASERRPVSRPFDQRGSAMMLMPAAVLIVVLLAAISVDRAVVFGAQRELVTAAQVAADNGASLGVDIDHLRSKGQLKPDPTAIERAISLAAVSFPADTTMTWHLEGDVVVVELTREVNLVFAGGVPGASTTEKIRARASAELRLSDLD